MGPWADFWPPGRRGNLSAFRIEKEQNKKAYAGNMRFLGMAESRSKIQKLCFEAGFFALSSKSPPGRMPNRTKRGYVA